MKKYSFKKEYGKKTLKCNYIYTEEQILHNGKFCFCSEEFYAPVFESLAEENIKGVIAYIVTVEDNVTAIDNVESIINDFNSISLLQEGEKLLKEKAGEITDLYISQAMGPGYYGMGLEEGKKIYRITEGESLGISINETGAMTPETTAAGFFLVSDIPVKAEKACRTCMGNKGGCSMCNLKCSGQIKNQFFNEAYEKCTDDSEYGICCDLGTTNIVCRLYDIKEKKMKGKCSLPNPEGIYGRDVITRQSFALRGEEEKKMLHIMLVNGINRCIERLTENCHIDKEKICKVVAGGNTTISHFLLDLSVEGISRSPFTPAFTEGQNLKAQDYGIKAGKDAVLYVPANLGGHVGSDITAGLLNNNIYNGDKPCIYIDIGTNGEIVLKDRDTFYVTSVAAGPVFEGGYLSCGMTAEKGAVKKVKILRNLEIETIENIEPEGICGSGVVSLICNMLKSGLIDKNGSMRDAEYMSRLYASKEITDRIEEGEEKRFRISEKVYITQDDIRKFQVAKAAIRAGIKILLKKRNLKEEDIDKIYITGAFGKEIDRKDLVVTGMVPDVNIIYIEESAAEGLSMILLNEDFKEKTERIRENSVAVFLNEESDFQEIYLKEMDF